MTVRGDLNTGNPGTEILNPVELRGQTGPFQLLTRLAKHALDISLFVRLLCHRGLIRRCHEFTHGIHENGTARNSEPLGPIRPDFDSLLWLSRNAQALALLPATTTLR
jgi:hypothetical protein